MITKACDRCEKLIQAPDDAAGKKVKCPHCGDINLFEAKAGSSPARTAATDSEPERQILRVRPEMLRARPLTFLGLSIGLIASISGVVYFLTQRPGNATVWVCVAAAVVFLGIFTVWKVKNLGSCLEVTNKRTIERLGLLSRFTSEILHEDVRNIQITQTFRERIMGIGGIGISSAGQDGLEITVQGIRNPDRIREIIDQYRPM